MAPKRARPSQERVKSDKFIHVHCFVDTGRWGAWVREPKQGGKRLYIGTHVTDRLAARFGWQHLSSPVKVYIAATYIISKCTGEVKFTFAPARCQDRALLKLETDPSTSQPIKLNFDRKDYEEDEHLRNTLSRAEFFKLLRGESRATYNKVQKTECLCRFLAQEQALGNLPTSSKDFTQQNSINNRESIGDSDDPPDHKNKTGKEEDYEDNSPDESSSNVVPQSSTGSYGVIQSTDSEATHDEFSSANDEPFASVASSATCVTKLSWNGKRRRRSAPLAPDEKKAIEGMLLLSIAT